MIVGGKEVYLLTPSLGHAVAAGPINVSLSGEDGRAGAHVARQAAKRPPPWMPAVQATLHSNLSSSDAVTQELPAGRAAEKERREGRGVVYSLHPS